MALSNNPYILFHDYCGPGIWSEIGWMILLLQFVLTGVIVSIQLLKRLVLRVQDGFTHRSGIWWVWASLACHLECLFVASLVWWPQSSKRECPMTRQKLPGLLWLMFRSQRLSLWLHSVDQSSQKPNQIKGWDIVPALWWKDSQRICSYVLNPHRSEHVCRLGESAPWDRERWMMWKREEQTLGIKSFTGH